MVSSSDSRPNETYEQPPILDVFTASAHGDFHKLRKFVEQDGSSVSVPDVNGYYALQWASLNNFYEIAHYLIQVLFPFFPPFFYFLFFGIIVYFMCLSSELMIGKLGILQVWIFIMWEINGFCNFQWGAEVNLTGNALILG